MVLCESSIIASARWRWRELTCFLSGLALSDMTLATLPTYGPTGHKQHHSGHPFTRSSVPATEDCNGAVRPQPFQWVIGLARLVAGKWKVLVKADQTISSDARFNIFCLYRWREVGCQKIIGIVFIKQTNSCSMMLQFGRYMAHNKCSFDAQYMRPERSKAATWPTWLQSRLPKSRT